MILVLDASAMVAYLRDEAGAHVMESALIEDEAVAYAHVLNITEVFYDFHRSGGEGSAQTALQQLDAMGVNIVTDMSPAFWQDAARLKSMYRAVSLADCFGVALARQLEAEFVTADRHELEALDRAGAANFTFIR